MKTLPLSVIAAVPATDQGALLASARALKRAALAGPPHKPLRGKNIGLLCDDPDSRDAELFVQAAAELGARVARLLPSASGLLAREDVPHTARMLGRLYDAMECQGLPADLVRQVRDGAGVPVYDALATERHPSAVLAELLEGGAEDPDNRRFVVQAVLISTMN